MPRARGNDVHKENTDEGHTVPRFFRICVHVKSPSQSALLFWLLFCGAQTKRDPIYLPKPTMRLVAEGSPCSLFPPTVTQQVPGAAGEEDCFLTHVITTLHTHTFV